MSAHTPGPWIAALGPGNTPVVLRADGEREQIATVTAYFARPDKSPAGRGWSAEGAPNARLIAAAPDLLASVKEELAEMERAKVPTERVARLRAVVAKAEGR